MSNGLVVPLHRLALGHLAGPARTPQQPPEVVGMVHNAEFLADNGADPFQGPQIVRKAVCPCPFQENLQKSPAFVFLQFPRATRNRFGLQSSRAVLEYRLLPSEDRRKRGTDAPGDLVQTQTALEQGNGPLPAPFQCLRGSNGSHPS